MKASENIKLVPAMSTFSLDATLAQAIKYVSTHKTGRSIVLHPIVAEPSTLEVTPFIISDEHWLMENGTPCFLICCYFSILTLPFS